MAGAWAGPCSTFIMTGWACASGEQARLKDGWKAEEERQEREESWRRM